MHTLTENELPSHTHDATIKAFTYNGITVAFFNAGDANKGGSW